MRIDWRQAIDAYCERTDPSYWSEPLNAVSNVAFLVAAVVIWRMARRSSDRAGQLLAIGAAAIGVGSFLFHTHATAWAMQADVYPIRLFVLVLLGLATVRFFDAPWWAGVLAPVAFVPCAIAVAQAARAAVGPLNGSVGYLPMLLLMVGAGAALWSRARWVANALLVAAAVFTLSLGFRTVDLALCAAWPHGTHFLWHTLNGLVIGLLGVAFVRSRKPADTVTA